MTAAKPSDADRPTAGHQVGIVIIGNLAGYMPGTTGATITLDTRLSKVVLPLVGGHGAAVSAGLF